MRSDRLEHLAAEFERQTGKIIVDVTEAAWLLRCHPSTLRRAVHRGELIASRRSQNGAMLFTTMALAEYFLEGERLSRPLPAESDEAKGGDDCSDRENGGGK